MLYQYTVEIINVGNIFKCHYIETVFKYTADDIQNTIKNVETIEILLFEYVLNSLYMLFN